MRWPWIAALLLTLACPDVSAQTWPIDAERASASFSVRPLWLKRIEGHFPVVEGVLVRDPEGGWMSAPGNAAVQAEPGVIVYRFGADLFYANEQRFTEELRRLLQEAPPPIAALVVDASAISGIDYSAAQALRGVMAEFAARGVTLVFGRVSDELRADLARHRITTAGAPGAPQLQRSMHSALAAARRASASNSASGSTSTSTSAKP